MRVARVPQTVALQRPEIVRISKLVAKRLEQLPVLLLTLVSELAVDVPHQVRDDAVVVEQRVVDVEQCDDGMHQSIMTRRASRALRARRPAPRISCKVARCVQ